MIFSLKGPPPPQYRVIQLWVELFSLVLLIPILWGSLPPPPPQGVYLSNPVQPVFRLPTAPVSGETPLHRLVASDRRMQELEQIVAATRQTIARFAMGGIRPPQSLLDSASSLSRDLEDARQSSSSQPGVSPSAKPTTPVQPGPSRPEYDRAVAGPSRRRSFDSPQHSLEGSDTPPRKRRRLSGDSSAYEDESSHTRRQRDDQQDDEDNFRPASLSLLLEYITRKFPAASKPLVQPSSKRFHVMETAGLVDESSPQSSNLAWFGHMRNACDSAQTKFEAKISEGRSLSSLLPSVSRTERVSDSPCQGKAVKVNSQAYDLMSSKPSESRSIPLSVKEAAGLETTLRGVMGSYNFQLWTVTALFRFLGDSGCCSMDDPLMDQFQRSFSRGAENVAAALASAIAFVTTKRRESFLSHMVPSVTDAQKRKLLSDPIFDQKDLFAPASIEAAREAARDVSLYRGAQSRPSMSSGSTQATVFFVLLVQGSSSFVSSLEDPVLSRTSLIRPTPPHAVLFPVFHQGKSLGEGVPRSPPQTSHRTGSSDSRLLQSPICGPEGFRGVAPHHRPVYPEHVHRISALSYGDSSVRPPFHSPRRLDDLIGSAGRVSSGSNPPGIASVSSVYHGRSSIPVQGTVLRADNCPSGLYEADGSNIRHSPSYGIRMLRYLDDWLILAESRTTCLRARDRLLHLCEELGLKVNLRKSSLVPSQDMTYLGMQILSVRFVAKPTETRVVNLLNIIEEFFHPRTPQQLSGAIFWATFRPLLFW